MFLHADTTLAGTHAHTQDQPESRFAVFAFKLVGAATLNTRQVAIFVACQCIFHVFVYLYACVLLRGCIYEESERIMHVQHASIRTSSEHALPHAESACSASWGRPTSGDLRPLYVLLSSTGRDLRPTQACSLRPKRPTWETFLDRINTASLLTKSRFIA